MIVCVVLISLVISEMAYAQTSIDCVVSFVFEVGEWWPVVTGWVGLVSLPPQTVRALSFTNNYFTLLNGEA